MSRIRFIVASLGTALAAASATTFAAVGASAAGPGSPAAPVSAHVWVTTPDGADKLTRSGHGRILQRHRPPRRRSSSTRP